MKKARNWKEGKLRVVIWVTVAMLLEAVLIFVPLGGVLRYTGMLSISTIALFIVVGFILGLGAGLVDGLNISLAEGLVAGLIYGLVDCLGIGLVVGLAARLDFGFVIRLIAGLVAGLIVGLVVVLRVRLAAGFGVSLIASLGGGLGVGLVAGLDFGFVTGLIAGFSIFAVTLFVMLLRYIVRRLSKGGSEVVKQFFTPRRSKRLYPGRSVGFFFIVYLGFVLLFALWFYASYLNATKEVEVWLSPPNPYFDTEDVFSLWFHASYLNVNRLSPPNFNTENIAGIPNYWTFVYFSFITIASLGYGDIYPTHWFSQCLVILETMVGVGLIAGFLAMIITVGGRGRRNTEARPTVRSSIPAKYGKTRRGGDI